MMSILQNDKELCDICKDLIPLVKDAVAGESSRKFVLDHIETCKTCRNEYYCCSAMPKNTVDDSTDKKILQKGKLGILLGAVSFLLIGLWLGIDISITGARFLFLIPIAVFSFLSIIFRKESAKRMYRVLGNVFAFAIVYFFWSNFVFFEYDIGAWVASECTLGAAFISVISAYFNKKYLSVFSFAGYNFGILAGGLFGQVSYDAGGGLLHNGWLIWILVFVGCIFVGCVLELIFNRKKKVR